MYTEIEVRTAMKFVDSVSSVIRHASYRGETSVVVPGTGNDKSNELVIKYYNDWMRCFAEVSVNPAGIKIEWTSSCFLKDIKD